MCIANTPPSNWWVKTIVVKHNSFKWLLTAFFNDAGGLVECDDFHFGSVCSQMSAPAPGDFIVCNGALNIDCGNQNSLEGTIFSPDFQVTNGDITFRKV